MANVQLENGYIKIANELFEQLFIREFSILQLKIIFLIIRCSYGFNKKLAVIKPQRLFEIAYVYRCDLKKELKNLQQNGVLLCNYDAGIFALNKNFDEWKIPFHKLFDSEKLAKLKKINIEAMKNVCVEQTEVFADNKQSKEDFVCPEQTSLPTTNNVVCAEQTEVFVQNKQEKAENTDGANDAIPSKDILNTDKDNNIHIGKRFLWDHEFTEAAEGSPQKVAVKGAAQPNPDTTGGHMATNNLYIISKYGLWEMVGLQWQWLANIGANGGSGWSGACGASNNKGQLYGASNALLAGGHWLYSSYCGSRSRNGTNGRGTVTANSGGRGACEPLVSRLIAA